MQGWEVGGVLVRLLQCSLGGGGEGPQDITSLVLTRKFQTEQLISQSWRNCRWLGIKYRFGDMGFTPSDSILGLWFSL